MGVKALKFEIDTLEDEREFREIDRLAETIPSASPFQTGLVAITYAQCPDAKPMAVVARDSRGAVVASLVATTFTHGRRSSHLSRLLTTHCTVRGNPLRSPSVDNQEALNELLKSATASLPPETLYLRWYPDRQSPSLRSLSALGFSRQDWLNYVLDIDKSSEQLLAGMSKHRRRGIRLAQRHGIVAREVETKRDLDLLFSILEASHRRLGVPLQSRHLFGSILENLVPVGRAMMLIAYYEKKACAGRVILLHGSIAYDWYSGSFPVAETLHADEILVWEAMLRAKERGATVFDLGGAGVPGEPYGPREFKRRFGGRETNWGRYTKVLRPSRLSVAKIGAAVLRRI